MVDVEFHNDSFVIKAIQCLSNFISHEYSAKPWNRYNHFTEFIKPKKNMAITLKDHRFNRLMDCSLALLYHFDDISSYLDKFSSISNGITVLDRSFLEMGILKPIFAAISLLGIHITRPFHALIINKETNYSTLLKAFPLLYKNLTEIDAAEYLTIKQVTTFTSSEIFNDSLPETCLLQHLSLVIEDYPLEITRFLTLAVKMFADGFSLQKGAIFGFGPNKDDDTGTVLKISDLTEKEVMEMDASHVQVHNLGEENNVGCVNYELNIRGKSNLETASRMIVLNRAADLLQSINPKEIKSFKKQAEEIKELRKGWNKKMTALEEQGYTEKEILNTKKDNVKLQDLELLKKDNPPGPFTNEQEVQCYIDDQSVTEDIKNKRMYTEVRYARNTCLSLKNAEKATMFRLKTSGQKNLSTLEYAENLIQYFGNTKNVENLSLDDFNAALLGVINKSSNERAQGQNREEGSTNVLSIGEHVALLRKDSERITWVIGIIEGVCDSQRYRVAQMSTKDFIKWTFPKKAVIEDVRFEDIICSNIAVKYCQTANICCTIGAKLKVNLNKKVASLSE